MNFSTPFSPENKSSTVILKWSYCLLKLKKKSFLWNLLFHAFVNYRLRMHHFGCKWKNNSGGEGRGGKTPVPPPPPFYHVATSNFNSACSILSYWIPWYILCNLSKPNLLGANFCVLSTQVFSLNRAQLITTLVKLFPFYKNIHKKW
jgi:hypothetical protein